MTSFVGIELEEGILLGTTSLDFWPKHNLKQKEKNLD